MLLYQNNTVYPIEVKKAASPGKAAIKNFSVLAPLEKNYAFPGIAALKVNVGMGSVICMNENLLPLDDKNWYVPVWLI